MDEGGEVRLSPRPSQTENEDPTHRSFEAVGNFLLPHAVVTRRADRRGQWRACSKEVWWLGETPKRPLMQPANGQGVLDVSRSVGCSLGRGDTPGGRGRGHKTYPSSLTDHPKLKQRRKEQSKNKGEF